MSVPNHPIRTQKSMGEGAMVLGVFTQSMMPGLTLALYLFLPLHFIVSGRYYLSGPPALALVIGYWLYVGNDRNRAWRNLCSHAQNDYSQVYRGSSVNQSVL